MLILIYYMRFLVSLRQLWRFNHYHCISRTTCTIYIATTNTKLRENPAEPASVKGWGPLQKSVLQVVRQTTTFPLPGLKAHVVWLSGTIVLLGKSVSENTLPFVHPLINDNICPVPAMKIISNKIVVFWWFNYLVFFSLSISFVFVWCLWFF